MGGYAPFSPAPNNLNIFNSKLKKYSYRNQAVFRLTGTSIPTRGIYFYTKDNKAGQKLKVYNIKLYVDSLSATPDTDPSNPTSYWFDTNIGSTTQRPNSSPSGSLYFDTDLNQLLQNKGDCNEVCYESINSISIINHEDTDTSVSNLEPNVYHKWGEITSLTINSLKNRGKKSIDEYMIEFVSGDTPTVLNIKDVRWVTEEPVIEANKTYQISIVNNIAVIGGA